MTIRIILDQPPPGVDYAVQKGHGSRYETILRQRSTGADLTFEFEIEPRNGDFYGPIVQGPKGGRFLYLNIGTSAGQLDSPWSRRLKVPLAGITSGRMFEARVPGTAKDGSPTCATQKPIGGWKHVA